MSKFKESLEYQQKVNEAASAIMDYFEHEMAYHEHVEKMADMQIEILKMVEVAKTFDYGKQFMDQSQIDFDEIVYFLMDVRQFLKFLKPFAELTNSRAV